MFGEAFFYAQIYVKYVFLNITVAFKVNERIRQCTFRSHFLALQLFVLDPIQK
jgi:hypothetical protein